MRDASRLRGQRTGVKVKLGMKPSDAFHLKPKRTVLEYETEVLGKKYCVTKYCFMDPVTGEIQKYESFYDLI